MPYSPIDKSSLHFNTVLYTGNASGNHAITGVNFRPDFLWIKPRSATDSHRIHSPLLTGSDYFLTSDADSGWNGNSVNYVSWSWKGAGSGSGSSNTDGSINTTATSVNTTAGISVSTYTGTGSTATIGHGLGAVPKFMLIKNRTDGSTDWIVYHVALGNAAVFHLNTTNNEQAASGVFNSTTPTSSLITLGTDSKSNGSSKNYICYAFAEKAGFSRFGVYRGNNNTDGTFVYTGFKPAWVLMKRNTAGASWSLVDTKRPGYNQTDKYLLPDTTATEQSTALDILSHGFKLRTTGGNQNTSATYYFAAFAEAPLVGSNNTPCTAR
jgi:hypothetical protein